MNIELQQEDLNKALKLVGVSVGEKAFMPFVKCVLLQVEDNQLALSCTDLTSTTRVKIPAKVHESGEIAIPHKLFSDSIDVMEGAIKMKAEEQALHTECGRSRRKFLGMVGEDFPPFPESEGSTFTIGGKDLKLALDQVSFAVAKQEARQELSGALFSLKDKLEIIGSDGFRLAYRTLPVSGDATCVIPNSSIDSLRRVLEEKMVIVRLGSNSALFVSGDVEFCTQVLNVKYPEVANQLPTSYIAKATLSTKAFLRACRGANVFAGMGSNTLKVVIGDGMVKMSVVAREVGDAMDEIEAEVEGSSEMLLDSRFLLQGLEEVVEDKVMFGVPDNSKVALVSKDYVYLVAGMSK